LAVNLVASIDNTLNSYYGIAYLFPLTILIPTWWIFFDKAMTISRIVGYYRNLERLILKSHTANFRGWENALNRFRRLQEQGRLKHRSRLRLKELLPHRLPHRYWILTYATFFGLSILCLAMSFFSQVNMAIFYLVLFVVLISAIWNAWVISELIWGRYSYRANERYWKKILKVKKIQETPNELVQSDDQV
jgi:hypothetical protein